jgi:hypothetical protein
MPFTYSYFILVEHEKTNLCRGDCSLSFSQDTEYLKIREFRIQSVVGDHFSSPNMEKKKIGTPLSKIHWSEGALFEVRFLQIQAKKFSVYCYLWYRLLWKIT